MSRTVFSGRQYADRVSFSGPVKPFLVVIAADEEADNGTAQKFFADLAAAAFADDAAD